MSVKWLIAYSCLTFFSTRYASLEKVCVLNLSVCAVDAEVSTRSLSMSNDCDLIGAYLR